MDIAPKTGNPLITVITVVYNDVAHIEETMLSVLNQTFKSIEYIVIDGGSKDGTADVIKKYAHRLAYWVSEKDGGISDAMNKGIDKAHGEWVNFINSGDYFASTTVFEEIFSKPHTADFLYGSFIGNFNGKSVLCVAHDSIKEKAWEGMQLCHSTLFARLGYLQRFKFNTKYRVSPDIDFVTRSIAAGCTSERLDTVIFRVGTLGNSAAHWLKGRFENWEIARTSFPGVRTDFYHARKLVQEVIFRTVKYLTSLVGIYQLARYFYRKFIQKKMPFLPKNVFPIENK